MKIVFATNNSHKVSEVSRLLPEGFDLVTLADCGIDEDIAETELTLEGNALLKARYIYNRYGWSCFADDTGLEVDALGGAPGVFSARYAEQAGSGALSHDSDANNTLLLRNLEGLETPEARSAQLRTVIAYIDGSGMEHLFEGIVRGYIGFERRGTEGFSYDPLFIPLDDSNVACLSFAEMTQGQKGAISHRGRAVGRLVDFFGSLDKK